METLLPRTLTMPSGIVMVRDAFEYWKSYAIFPDGEKSWNEKFQNMINSGEIEMNK
jgi:hypothetical protein